MIQKQADNKKGKDSYYVRMERGRVVTIQMRLHKEETTSFTPFKDVHHANRDVITVVSPDCDVVK